MIVTARGILAATLILLLFIFLHLLPHYRGVERGGNAPQRYKLGGGWSPPKCFIKPLSNLTELRHYFSKSEAPCTNLKAFAAAPPASSGDRKLMCLDPYYNIRPGSCLVLSFGVGQSWHFEDEVAEFGCEVAAFDPTNGLKDHKRGDKISFYSVGISNFRGSKLLGMMRYGKKTVGAVDRYENLLARAGLQGRVVDYLKLDVELSELEFFQDMFFNSPHLLAGVKQIAMEVHHDDEGDVDLGPASVYQLFWTYYQLLRCHGFRLILTYNHNSRRKWTEVLWGRKGAW
uniref:Methyltransferase domain-containing protein n=1 Tax=Scylla olivacea TaxID=85551 RepID=A0A0P4WQP4_SCYOL